MSMLVPQTVEYALRAMAYLATRAPGTAVPAQELSEAAGIPVHYLSKVLRRLVRARLLSARKGHGGGFALARPKDRIVMLEIMAALDWSPRANRCAFGWGSCDPDHPCPLHPTWSRLSEAFATWAQTSTLADVGPMPSGRRVLPVRPAAARGTKRATKARTDG